MTSSPAERSRRLLLRAAFYGTMTAGLWAAGRAAYLRLQSRAADAEKAAAAPSEFAGRLGDRRLPEAIMESGSDAGEAAAVAAALARVLNPRRLSPDDSFTVLRSTDGRFLHLTWIHGQSRAVVSAGEDGRLRSILRPLPLTPQERAAAGKVGDSLWVSMAAEGVPPEAILRFAEAFEWTVDFLTETRSGDRFAVVWTERRGPDGRAWDRVIRAGLYEGKATGRRLAVWFDGEHYDEKGESLRRMFLRAPLRFTRISSRFTTSRRHPILRISRPHHGTDYAAPRGTPVSTVADGVVTFAGRKGGFGNAVQIRHNSTYTTLYGHLNRIAPGIRPGARVRQGQVIGQVGSTGLATGPHLHFQIERNGAWVDFLTLKVPFAHSVPKAKLAAFRESAGELLAKLAALPAEAKAHPL